MQYEALGWNLEQEKEISEKYFEIKKNFVCKLIILMHHVYFFVLTNVI